MTRAISVEAQGEVLQLKDNINQMIANLRDTTRALQILHRRFVLAALQVQVRDVHQNHRIVGNEGQRRPLVG